MRFFNESETRREINAALDSDFIPMAERIVFFFYFYYHFFLVTLADAVQIIKIKKKKKRPTKR